MGLILVRYGEVALKGGNRSQFIKRLRYNIRDCLKKHGLDGEVRSVRGRIMVETDDVDAAVEGIRKVFGVVSLSPVAEVASSMESIREEHRHGYDGFERRIENGRIVLYGKVKGFKEGLGGGFRYCTLGPPLFDETGAIRPEVSFNDLAAHVYFTETGEPLSERPSRNSPLIGQAGDTAYYLFFNGVRGGSLLDARTLRRIEEHAGPVVVYADGCTLSAAMLKQHNVTFKQTPYEVTTR